MLLRRNIFTTIHLIFCTLLLLLSTAIKMNGVAAVGQYTPINDEQLLSSTEIMDIANHVLTQLPSRVRSASTLGDDDDEFLSFLEVTDEKVRDGDVFVKVLEAERQVVAGTNYKLTISIHPKHPSRPTTESFTK